MQQRLSARTLNWNPATVLRDAFLAFAEVLILMTIEKPRKDKIVMVQRND
jgi:hypothetical protein